jgi:hypothetical protein
MLNLINSVQENIKDSQEFILDVFNIPTNQDQITTDQIKAPKNRHKSKKRKVKKGVKNDPA